MTEKRRRLSVEARREELLDAALAVAAGGDLAAVSVADIATHAGVSESLLYHYWPNKQALVTAAVQRAATDLLATLQHAGAAGGAAERLHAAVDAYLTHVQSQPTSWRALLAARTGDAGRVADEVERLSHEFILHTLGVHEATPGLQVVLAGWSAFERDACLAWLDQPDLTQAQLKALLFSTFIAALTTLSTHDATAGRALSSLTT